MTFKWLTRRPAVVMGISLVFAAGASLCGYLVVRNRAAALVTVAGIVIGTLLILRPKIGLSLIFVYSVINPAISATSGSVLAGVAINLGFILILVVTLARSSHVALARLSSFLPLWVFGALALVEMINPSPYGLLNAVSDAAQITFPAMAFGLGLVSSVLRPREIAWAVTTAATGVAILGLGEVAHILPVSVPALVSSPLVIAGHVLTRPVATLGTFALAAFCGLGLLTSLYLATTERRLIGRVTSTAAGLICAATIIATGVRAVWVGAAIALLFHFFASKRANKPRIVLALIPLAVAVAVLQGDFVSARLRDVIDPSNPDSTLVGIGFKTLPGRTYFWSILWAQLLRHPLGFGMGTFGLSRFFQEGSSLIVSGAAFPDNDYLYIALETGFAGIILYLMSGLLIARALLSKAFSTPPSMDRPWIRTGVGVLLMVAVASISGAYFRHEPASWVAWFILGHGCNRAMQSIRDAHPAAASHEPQPLERRTNMVRNPA